MLTIADKGGGVLKKYQQRVVIGKKMRGERRIDLDLTIHVHQSHVTCKLDPYKLISPAKKSTSKIVVQKGRRANADKSLRGREGGKAKC